MTTGRAFALAGFSAGLLALNAGTLRALIELSFANPTASHLVIVPFVSAVLIWRERDAIFSSPVSDTVPALALAAAGGALMRVGYSLRTADRQGDALSASVAALVLLWFAGFMLAYGRKAFRAGLFPLLFMVLVIPIPPAALDAATQALKAGSAETVAMLFAATGTPFNRDGFTFSLPNVVIIIADECSGIRSSIGLLLTSLLMGHLFLRTAWKKALLAGVMFPLAIVKNAIRIVTLVLLSIHVNPDFLTGQLHSEGGIVFYVLTLVIAAPLFTVLQRSEHPLLQEMHS